jgi:PTS system nitrogen regulatory IIA component
MTPRALFSPDTVFAQLACVTKKQTLKELAGYAEERTGLDAGEVFSTLMEREQAVASALGRGAAIPQARFDGINKLHVLAATLAYPVEYGAVDGQPVDIVFMLLIPPSSHTEHLKAVATLTRMMRNAQLCRAIRAAKTPEDLYGVLTYEHG